MADRKPIADYAGILQELSSGDTVPALNGGTGLSSYTLGDLIYSSATNTLLQLGIGTVGQVLTVVGGVPSWADAAGGGVTDHGALTGLVPDDDHTQYALLAGRGAGQTLTGGTAANNSLQLKGTSDAAGGFVVSTDVVRVITTAKATATQGLAVTFTADVAEGLSITGIQALTETQNTSSTSLVNYAINCLATHSGTAAQSSLIGVHATANYDGPCTRTYAGSFGFSSGALGPVTIEAAGVDIRRHLLGAASVALNYGLFIGDQTAGTTNYSIYTDGSAVSSFGGVIASRVVTGTAPFVIASTTLNTNLNADLLDGLHASSFAAVNPTSGTVPVNSAGAFVDSPITVAAGRVGIGVVGFAPTAALDVRDTSGGEVVRLYGSDQLGFMSWFEPTGNATRGIIGYGDDGNIISGATNNSFAIRAEFDLHIAAGGNNLAITVDQTTRDLIVVEGDTIILAGALRQSSLTLNTLPYHVSDAVGLADSPITTDGIDMAVTVSEFRWNIGVSGAKVVVAALGGVQAIYSYAANNTVYLPLRIDAINLLIGTFSGGLVGMHTATPTAGLTLGPSTVARSQLRMITGTAPTTPNEGDCWYDGTNLVFRDSTTSRIITWT